jgi:hypothetical protein
MTKRNRLILISIFVLKCGILFAAFGNLKPSFQQFAPTPDPSAVTGPGSGTSTDEAIVRWDGVTGTLIQDSANGPFGLDDGKFAVGTSAPARMIHVRE